MQLTPSQAQDKELIYYLLRQIVPENISVVHPIIKGKASYTYEVNNHLIVKFPKYKNALADDWKKQNINAPILQKALSFKIPQPKLESVFLNATSTQGMLSLSYEKIEGYIIPRREFGSMPLQFKQKFFKHLSDATAQIHAINPNTLPSPPITAEQFGRKLFPIQEGNTSFNKLFDIATNFLKKRLHNPSKRVLCHLDLHSGNICLNKKGEFVGIIDFDTLIQGYPCLEFRPSLYPERQDMEMFKKAYIRQSKNTNLNKDIQQMLIFYKLLSFTCSCAKIKKLFSSKNMCTQQLLYSSRHDFSKA